MTILITHPDNLKHLESLPKQVKRLIDSSPFLKIEVRTDKNLSPTERKSKIIWRDDKFVQYSDSEEEEYINMCIYFGWAEREYVEEPLFYLVDGSKFIPNMLGN